VQCLEPGKFYLTAIFASMTFNLFVYTMTVSFGDIGKAFAVIIMILQIAGSSGTYPIEILPSFYQNLYIYFPFPYAINAMRETIGGLYENDYWMYMGQLGIFVIVALVIGLVIRRPFIHINHYVEKRMRDTKMM
jgi:putative membrane protein